MADKWTGLMDGPNNLQNDGGLLPIAREFEVKEKGECSQPQDSGSWNDDMDNPLGPK